LVIYLIGKHAFFEGNTEYRVDPEKMCRVLELNSNKYTKITERTWKWCGVGDCNEAAESAAKRDAEEIYQIDDFATAYLRSLDAGNGKRYCHIFNHKIRKERKKILVNEIKVEKPLEFKGASIFELEECTYAELV